jgi:hypothetical protein
MKNQTKKTLEDAIPTLIEGYKVMSDRTIEPEYEPEFEVTELKETFHINYKWFVGEITDSEPDPQLRYDDKQYCEREFIIKKSQPFIDFVHGIVEALDTITENKYNFNL